MAVSEHKAGPEQCHSEQVWSWEVLSTFSSSSFRQVKFHLGGQSNTTEHNGSLPIDVIACWIMALFIYLLCSYAKKRHSVETFPSYSTDLFLVFILSHSILLYWQPYMLANFYFSSHSRANTAKGFLLGWGFCFLFFVLAHHHHNYQMYVEMYKNIHFNCTLNYADNYHP